MNEFEIGVKVYDSDWLLKYDLSPQDAAQLLKEWGVNFVLAQSRYLPMPDSAVDSQLRPDKAGRYTHADDREFRAALAKEDIGYWATVCTFFNPTVIETDPSLRPVGSDGRPMEQTDWYMGIAPSMEEYVTGQVAAIEHAVKALQPDGLFLSFTRWPGFWELWMPHHIRQDLVEYSFDPHSLERFVRETGLNLPTREAAEAAAWIEVNARDSWTSWKCQVVTDVIRQVKRAGRKIKPNVQIMLNTLPFRARDFDGAREKTFGQQIETLNAVVDVFEVMTYHQIQRRPVDWIPRAGMEVKQRSGRKTVCTIQARPLYLDGIYASDGRSPTLDAQEFAQAIGAVEAAGLDGIVVFIWSDLLAAALDQADISRIDAMRAAVERRRDRMGSL
jgi:hypothetical protein